MINRLKQFSILCGIALMLAAFPVFAQENSAPEINKKPLQDFGGMLIDRVQRKEVDLSKNFLVELISELTKDGKFDLSKTKYIKSEGDRQMIDAAKSAIEAVNNSGIFVYVSGMDISKIDLIVAQDDENMYMIFKSDSVSENKAKTKASGLKSLAAIGKIQAKDDDAKTLLAGTNVFADGKSVIIKTSVEKSVGQAMIQREMEKESARRQ